MESAGAVASLIPMKQGLLSAWRFLTWPWRRFPNGRALWLNGEGHLVPQERPVEIARIISDFVAGLPSRP